MNLIPTFFLAILIAVATTAAPLAAAEPAKATKSAKGAKPAAQANLREVEYTDLERHVGAQLVVQTTNDTVRNGTLIKYTNVGLTVRLGPDAGSIDLSMPRNTVRKVSVAIAPADPLFPSDTFQQEAKPGAKKN
jgi:hypothetical protein